MILRFLDYVEIKTKITSTFTFLLTLLFLLYQGRTLAWKETIVFFMAMFLFDLTTTAINNYIDSKDNGQILPFERKRARFLIYGLFAVSTGLGLYLAYETDLVVLVVGGLCFFCGVFYTYGPIPISRQPLGEVFSGFFYGAMIPFLLAYINSPEGTYLSYHLSVESISLELKVLSIGTLLLLCVTPFCVTANIMLANNICDLEKDITVKRYTLPYYIGEYALPLFAGLYYITYFASILMVVFRILPPIYLVSLLSMIPVQKNIHTFYQKQMKEETFVCSIQNFILIMGGNILALVLCLFFQF
ncbi:MAG: 1,4-dihydroxy-2-naphthoate polyprenyltransferase [Clostridiales bacterium]|nr:1,4-dihydroxy-2-naphthoate polyprenyltransferase [Clostridiales bacterium]